MSNRLRIGVLILCTGLVEVVLPLNLLWPLPARASLWLRKQGDLR